MRTLGEIIDKCKDGTDWPTQWQPIETAPKEGTPILTLRGGDLQAVAEWDNYNIVWVICDGPYIINVTHWMPLPSPPETSNQ